MSNVDVNKSCFCSSDSFKLFLLGFLTLFLELVLIRYLSGNIWNLGFFPNLVLLGAFLGIAIGFVFHHYLSDRVSKILFWYFPLALMLLILIVHFFRPYMPGFKDMTGEFGGELFFTSGKNKGLYGGLFMFFIWFFSVVFIFAMIAQATAKLFAKFEPLKAYTLDIAGSCFGILAFMAMSFFGFQAIIWFLLLLPLYFFTANFEKKKMIVYPLLAFCVISVVILDQDTKFITKMFKETPLEITWSPYQKVKITKEIDKSYIIHVNGVAHQDIKTPEGMEKSCYNVPFKDRRYSNLPKYKRVLIIGSGSGNDIGAALRHGAEKVDAVEIDPIIAYYGTKYNPIKPYLDPRVNVIVDDGRAVLTRAKEKYDLIIFAVTDSLIKVSPMAQLRLENYLFTKESMKRAYSLLKR